MDSLPGARLLGLCALAALPPSAPARDLIEYFTFAVIDSEKDIDQGSDNHGRKVIVVPFDGTAFDADQAAANRAP